MMNPCNIFVLSAGTYEGLPAKDLEGALPHLLTLV